MSKEIKKEIKDDETYFLARKAFLAVERHGRVVQQTSSPSRPFGTSVMMSEWMGLGKARTEYRSSYAPVWRLETGNVVAEMNMRTVSGVVDKTIRLTQGAVEDLRSACKKIIDAVPDPAPKSSVSAAPVRAPYAPVRTR